MSILEGSNVTSYKGNKAAQWCRSHAKDRQPFVDACARFVSLGLKEGGLPQTDEWNLQGEEKVTRGTVLGSPTSRVADRLVRYLINNGYAEERLIYDVGETFPQPELPRTIPDARLGDVIAYKYRGPSSRFAHVSMVVNTTHGIPLVSEWGTAHNRTLQCPYRERRWYWSQNSRQAMDQLYDLVVVHLRMK